MLERNVTIVSPQSTQGKRFATGANNWGQLKQEFANNDISTSGMEAILSPGRHTLAQDDAELPSVDFRVFLVPTKNKAGLNPEEKVTLNIISAIRKAAPVVTKEDMDALEQKLIGVVEAHYDADLSDPDMPSLLAVREPATV